MRYGCPKCNCEFDIKGDQNLITCPTVDGLGDLCDRDLIKLPDYETPEQYEKRTGNEWNGAVWHCRPDKFTDEWFVSSRKDVERMHDNGYRVSLCANTPESPGDFLPEEIL